MSKKIYNFTLAIIITILLILLIRSALLQNYENFIPIITTLLTFFVPKFFEKIVKIEIPYSLKIFFIIFIFMSKFLGGDNFYFSSIPLYDKIIHAVYGIFSCFVSIFILVRFTRYNNKNILYNILFFIAFALGTSVLWEFLEYFADNISLGNNQRLETGITDTMLDLIYTFISSILFSICYYIELKLNKNMLIYKFINSLNKAQYFARIK